MAKNTNDLLDQLADNNCSIDDYLEENREDMIVLAAKDFWEAAIERSGMSKCNIINKADFNYCYFYDIVNGRKIASRDKVIRLILSMRLTTDAARRRCVSAAAPPCIPRYSGMHC